MDDFKVIEHGYSLDLNRIVGGWELSPYSCHAPNKNKAKSIIIKKLNRDYLDLKHSYSQKEITYLNIPIDRDKRFDLVEFDGVQMTRSSAKGKQREKEKNKYLDDILVNPDITHCYIMKRGQYYGDNYCGYTERQVFAGVYQKSDAIKEVKRCDELTVRPIEIDSHNALINHFIERIKKHLI
ncbi:hypothetical protein ACR78H_25075 [Sphingobacterium siyangense]|uniref:hypothetical protein n=1 Tax=Sphingobacterium siyangense TaxID=459529 RepID=UPI003DA63D88